MSRVGERQKSDCRVSFEPTGIRPIGEPDNTVDALAAGQCQVVDLDAQPRTVFVRQVAGQTDSLPSPAPLADRLDPLAGENLARQISIPHPVVEGVNAAK